MDRDDVLTDSRSMLQMLLRPSTAQEISTQTTTPIKEVQTQLNELVTDGLIASYKGCYVLTDKGRISIDLGEMQYN